MHNNDCLLVSMGNFILPQSYVAALPYLLGQHEPFLTACYIYLMLLESVNILLIIKCDIYSIQPMVHNPQIHHRDCVGTIFG